MLYTFRTNEDVKNANLSYYTLCELADYMQRVYPMHAMEDFLKCNGLDRIEMRTDECGNYIGAQCFK